MKTFSEIKEGDKLYFLFDTYHILQECGNSSMGFANRNYGLVICSRTVASHSWEWHSPRSEDGTLLELRLNEPIYDDENEKQIFDYRRITKKEGDSSCIKMIMNEYYRPYAGYIFTTKEELEKKVREITDIVESNLNKINNAIAAL